ncbi:hypothetical protein TELCIR_00575 [Teladorsagia circumcincta]|uniref:Apple domain-containing protein n=1 Tax=Teladorsagia circumcincta TaxID=45464 RepID=A0A2G9V4H0_TELCI|nr:hypothetical protein TELCIR_00575 [Teladorsagia circumcincta]
MIVLLFLLGILPSSRAISSTCFYLPNINLKGGTYDEFDASDITQCCIQCASQPCCAGYTYSKALKRCFMKSSINYSEQEDMMISGIRANANGGQNVSNSSPFLFQLPAHQKVSPHPVDLLDGSAAEPFIRLVTHTSFTCVTLPKLIHFHLNFAASLVDVCEGVQRANIVSLEHVYLGDI